MVVAEEPQSEYRVRVIEAVSTIAEDEEEEVFVMHAFVLLTSVGVSSQRLGS